MILSQRHVHLEYEKEKAKKPSPKVKHVYRSNSNKFVVSKSIDGKNKYFGTFETLHEAVQYRDRLIANNWEPLPEAPSRKNERLQQEYWRRITLSTNKTQFKVHNYKWEYLGQCNTLEEALYYRDMYVDYEPDDAPRPYALDLKTDNPYYSKGFDYPVPERLKPIIENRRSYGKGTITKKGACSYHVYAQGKFLYACPTFEMADYVRKEMCKRDWDRNQLQEVIDNYPRHYTKLLYFYSYVVILKEKWYIQVPKDYLKDKTKPERWGPYNKIEDCLFERDFLMDNNWDYELLVESIDDSQNPYYDMDLPPYPERRIKNVQFVNYHEKELSMIADLIREGYPQKDIIEETGIIRGTMSNWLKKWDTNYKEFRKIVLNGDNPLEVLEKKEKIYQPDLSRPKPPNFNNYISRTRGRYIIMRKGEYFGSYEDEKLAKKIMRDLRNCDWDKSKLKQIQKKHGFQSPVNSKRWVYKQGNRWGVRRKNKDKRMITYGSYLDKRVAELVRDLLIMYGWDMDNMDWIEDVSEYTIKTIDQIHGSMFGEPCWEDIEFLEIAEDDDIDIFDLLM